MLALEMIIDTGGVDFDEERETQIEDRLDRMQSMMTQLCHLPFAVIFVYSQRVAHRTTELRSFVWWKWSC